MYVVGGYTCAHPLLMLCISVGALQFCCCLALLLTSGSSPWSRAGEGARVGAGCARAERGRKPSLKYRPANCSLLCLGRGRVGQLLWVCCEGEERAPRGYRKVRRDSGDEKQDGIAIGERLRQCGDVLGRR